MIISLIKLIELISKKIPNQKFSKLGFGASLGQLEIRIIRNLAIVFLLSTFYFLLSTSVFAQQKQTGITVIPSIWYVDLATDPPEYDLKYINNTGADLTLKLSAQDFTELEDGYKLSFLEGKDAKNYKYSLSSWISFENKNLELLPGEEKTVKVFIDKDRITKGGHYASILARVDQSNSKKAININPVISSLLFVRAATGLEVEDGKISSFKPNRNLLDFPGKFVLRFQNNGNVYVIPYGRVEIYDPLGHNVAKGILNEGSLNALPESIRRYDIKTQTNSKILLPGIYKAHIDMHFGNANRQLNQEVKFFSWGSFNFIKIGSIMLLLLIGIYYLRRKKSK